jgi:hypothetical protein
MFRWLSPRKLHINIDHEGVGSNRYNGISYLPDHGISNGEAIEISPLYGKFILSKICLNIRGLKFQSDTISLFVAYQKGDSS